MKNSVEYANWIPRKLPAGSFFVTVLLAAAAFTARRQFGFFVMLTVLAVLCGAFAVYMAAARKALSYRGGNVQGKVLDRVLSYLEVLRWDGTGRLLDIGCGSGAMSVKAAEKYPLVSVTGVDYWGTQWDYSKAMCENNARVEGVADRVRFQKGDAANMSFPDESFDAAVSNFVFHEVRSQPDKLALFREALRVLKPGGVFVIEDIFYSKTHYGEIRTFIKQLQPEVSEIHFVDTRPADFAPRYLNTPLVLG